MLKEKLFRIKNDLTIRYPHRKIMDFLSEFYNAHQNKFEEVHFSKIVKECRLGKNKANEYFGFLVHRGLIECRSDGYRKFFRVKSLNI